MIYLLFLFISILVGAGLGVFLSTYYYPQMPSLEVLKNFHIVLPFFLAPIVIAFAFRLRSILITTLIVLIGFLSFCYSTVVSKNRLDTILTTPSQNFIVGTVSVSFLNKIFVNVSNYTVIVYLRDFDYEYTSLGSQVLISGRSKHTYSYLTNKDMYGYFLYLFKNNIPFVVYSKDDTVGEVIVSDSVFLNSVNTIRQDIYNKFSEYLPHTSFLSSSLIMGESSEISKEFMESIRLSGVSHIFSVSGFHVSIIVIAFVIFLSLMRIPKFVQFIVISIFLAGYSLIVGLKPPVVRASVLASIILLIRSFSLKPNYLNITLIVGVIMLMIDPLLSVDVGFILSFLAIISIILFTKYVDDVFIFYLNKLNIEPSKQVKSIISLFSVSLTAVIFTLPVVILWFGESPLMGIFSSVVLVPISSLNIVYGVVAYLVSLLSSTLGEIMFRGLNLINLIFIIITQMFASVDLSVGLRLESPFTTGLLIIAYYAIVVFLYLFVANPRLPLYFMKRVLETNYLDTSNVQKPSHS